MTLESMISNLEAVDLYAVSQHGLGLFAKLQLQSLCEIFISSNAEIQGYIRSITTRKVSWLLTSFATDQLSQGLNNPSEFSLKFAVSALDLAEIVSIDYRDSISLIAELQYLAQLLNVELINFCNSVLPLTSREILDQFKQDYSLESVGLIVAVNREGIRSFQRSN